MSVSTAVSNLREKLHALDDNKEKVRQTLQRSARSQRVGQSQKCTAFQKRCARVLMVLQAGEPTAAIRFLTLTTRAEATSTVRKDAAELRTWWLSCTVDARNLLITEESLTQYGQAALNRARKFLVESDLEAWVDTMNVTKGITPHSAVVLEKSHKLCIEHHVPLNGRKRKKHAFQWLRRWRRKWAVHVSTLPPNEMLPVSQLQEKAQRI